MVTGGLTVWKVPWVEHHLAETFDGNRPINMIGTVMRDGVASLMVG